MELTDLPRSYKHKSRINWSGKLLKMNVGDKCFFKRTMQTRVSAAIWRYEKKTKMKFITRQTRRGVMVWRVE